MKPNFPVDTKTYDFRVVSPIQLRFNDLDVFAHVNNAIHQHYFDIGRADYLRRIDTEKFYSQRVVPLVVSIKTDFLSPIVMEDEVEVRTTIYAIGARSLKMFQIIVAKNRDTICSASESVMAVVDMQTNTSTDVPPGWRSAIANVEGREM